MAIYQQQSSPRMLILDDNPAAAFMLRQLLYSLPVPRVEVQIHQSVDGLLPENAGHFDACFLAYDYGARNFLYTVQELRKQSSLCPIYCIIGEKLRIGDRQEALEAARLGVRAFLVHEDLSVNHLAGLLVPSFRPTENLSIAYTPAAPAPHHTDVFTAGNGLAGHIERRMKPDPVPHELFASDSQGKWVFDLGQKSAWFVAETERLLGYQANELGHTIADWKSLIHPDDIDGLIRELNNCLAQKPIRTTLWYRIKTHGDRWLTVTNVSLRLDDPGHGERVIGIFQPGDIQVEEVSPKPSTSLPPEPALAETTLAEAARPELTDRVTDNQQPDSFFVSLFENCATGILVYTSNRDGSEYHIKFLNKAAETISGYVQADIIGKKAADYFPRFDDFNLYEALDRVRNTGIPESHKLMALNKGKAPLWRKYHFSRLDSGDILTEFEDISDEMNLIQGKRQQEEIWQHIVHSYPDSSLMLDDNGTILQLVSSDCSIFNADPENLIGDSITTVLGASHGAQCLQSISRALNTGKTQTDLYKLENDRSVRWIECRTAPLRSTPGAPIRAIWSAREATDQQRANELLLESRDHLASVINNLPAIIHMKDLEGRYLLVNPLFEKIYGVNKEIFIGKMDFEIFPDELATELYEVDRRVIESGEICENIHTIGQGNLRGNYLTINFPMRDSEERLTGTCGISIDIDKLSLVHRPNKTGLGMPLSENMKNDFSSILTTLMGYVELALMNQTENNEGKKIADYLQNLVDAGNRARELILQNVTQNRQGSEKNQTVRLAPIVENVIEVVSATLTNNHSIVKKLGNSPAQIVINPIKLQQALLLMLAGMRDTMESGTITVELHAASYKDKICSGCKQPITGNFIELMLQGNSKNLSGSDLQPPLSSPLVFQPGQLDHKGLAAIHQVLHEHGGHLLVTENESAGTIFSLLFVAAEEDNKHVTAKKISVVTELHPGDRKNCNH